MTQRGAGGSQPERKGSTPLKGFPPPALPGSGSKGVSQPDVIDPGTPSPIMRPNLMEVWHFGKAPQFNGRHD